MLSTKCRTCSEPLGCVSQLTAGRRQIGQHVTRVQDQYQSGDVLERGYNSEAEVVADLAGLLSDGQTDRLAGCNVVAARRRKISRSGTRDTVAES